MASGGRGIPRLPRPTEHATNLVLTSMLVAEPLRRMIGDFQKRIRLLGGDGKQGKVIFLDLLIEVLGMIREEAENEALLGAEPVPEPVSPPSV